MMGWKEKVDIIMELIYIQFIHTEVTLSDGCESFFTPTYPSHREDGRKDLWDNWMSIAQSMRGGWIIGGDFNDILSASEKRGGSKVSSRRLNVFM